MKHRIKIMLVVLFTLIPFTTHAWNALGHMVVANIAYQNLKPDVRVKVDNLVTYLHQEYSDMDSFVKIAYWADTLRSQKIESYTHWHYVDIAFSRDGTSLKNLVDTDNAVWALGKIEPVVKNIHANPYERARFLAFMVHIVGDLHQPLHTVSYISAKNPEGDEGGNLYGIRYNNEKSNLHKLWDSGVGIFEGDAKADRVNAIANLIMAHYPENYFNKQPKDKNVENWLKEQMIVAQQYVYNTPENIAVSAEYIEAGRKVAEQQAALAGYRLAGMLNLIFA